METVFHGIEPIYNKESKILILGTFPSIKSREGYFFYHHPQNRFWKVLSLLLKEELPISIEQKKEMLLKHHIAIWDVIYRCDIVGSSDSSIKNVIPNDLGRIFKEASILRIFANGAKAEVLYQKYCKEIYQREIIKLPSTSPANAGSNLEKLASAWMEIIDYVGETI